MIEWNLVCLKFFVLQFLCFSDAFFTHPFFVKEINIDCGGSPSRHISRQLSSEINSSPVHHPKSTGKIVVGQQQQQGGGYFTAMKQRIIPSTDRHLVFF